MKLVPEHGRWRLRLGLRGQMLGLLGLMMFLVVIIFSMLWMNEKTNHGRMLALTESAMRSIDQENLKRRGEALVSRWTPEIAGKLQAKDFVALKKTLRDLKKQNDVVYAIVFDNQGIIVAEALMRWQHPRLGMVPPASFIEVAEQSGLIEMLGRHALVLACNDAAMWASTEKTLPFVSVNVSSKQLRGGELVDVVETVLASSGLKPHQLHLELTETAILGDENQASVLLSRIRAMGVKVWLDDFGTGFSGLSHLRRVPVDGVKIDRSFVTDLLRDPDDLALTTSIIAMAHSLGITVVAEGIETEGQYAVLRERGCDQGQGFWLGRPMLAQEVAKLFVA